MQINVGSVIFAVISIAIAKVATVLALPFLNEALEITAKQQEWLFLLTVWSFGYWGYSLKTYLKNNIWNKSKDKILPVNIDTTGM